MQTIFLLEKKLAIFFHPPYRRVLVGIIVFVMTIGYWIHTLADVLLSQQVAWSCGTNIHSATYASCVVSAKESIGIVGFLIYWLALIFGILFDLLFSIVFPFYITKTSKHVIFATLKLIICSYLLYLVCSQVAGLFPESIRVLGIR